MRTIKENAVLLFLILNFAILSVLNATEKLTIPDFDNIKSWETAVAEVIKNQEKQKLLDILKFSQTVDGFHAEFFSGYLAKIFFERPVFFLETLQATDSNFKVFFAFILDETGNYSKNDVLDALNPYRSNHVVAKLLKKIKK